MRAPQPDVRTWWGDPAKYRGPSQGFGWHEPQMPMVVHFHDCPCRECPDSPAGPRYRRYVRPNSHGARRSIGDLDWMYGWLYTAPQEIHQAPRYYWRHRN